MNVFFKRHNNSTVKIGQCCNYDDAWEVIAQFLREKRYSYYYIRTWMHDDEKWYDVGSHTEFFVVTPKDTVCNTTGGDEYE